MSTELDELVIRLTGDAEEYKRMLLQSVDQTKEAAEQITGFSKKIEEFGQVVGAGLAALGISAWLREATAAWEEAETTVIRLNAVLEANGRNVETLSQDYQDFALEIQYVTKQSDEAVTQLLTMAETFGLTGEAAKKATKEAIAFAAINSSSAQGMLRVTAAMAQGDIERAMMFSRMIPQLRGVKNETEFLAKYTKIAAAGWNVAEREAQTFGGRMKQLAEEYGNFMEIVGKSLTDVLKPMIETLRFVAKEMQNISPWILTVITTTASLVVGMVALAGIVKVVTLAWAGLKLVAMAAFVSIPGIILTVVGTLVTLLAHLEKLKEYFSNASDELEKLARTAMKGIPGFDKLFGEKSNEDIGEMVRKKLQKIHAAWTMEAGKEEIKLSAPELKHFDEAIKSIELLNRTMGMGAKEAEVFTAVLIPLEEKIRELQESAWGTDETGIENLLTKLGLAKEKLSEIRTAEQGSEAQAMLGELLKEHDALGKTTEELKLFEMASKGAAVWQLSLAAGLVQASKAFKEKEELDKKMKEDAKQVFESTRTPLEKYTTEVSRLSDMVMQGALDWNTYTRAVLAAHKALEDATKIGVEAFEFGSLGAVQASQQQWEGGLGDDSDPAKMIGKVLVKMDLGQKIGETILGLMDELVSK